MIRFFSLFILMAFASCTTIEIQEDDVFDVKRTIGPYYFKGTDHHLEEVTFISGRDIHLEGWFISHPDAKGTVLFFGGNGFLMETSHWAIRSIVEQKMNLFVFNYRGYGKNPGVPTISGLKADAMAAYNYLVDQRGISPKRLILHGHSMGTLIGGYVADQHPVAGVVLESPMTNVRFYTEKMIPGILKPFLHFKVDSNLLAVSNIDKISRLSVPLLIMVGNEDLITPPEMARKLYETAPTHSKTLKILNNGGHNNLAERNDYRSIIASFYSKALS